MFVYPRLSDDAARVLIDGYADMTPVGLRQRSAISHPDAATVAVGGSAVSQADIAGLSEALRELADRVGFPEPIGRARVGEFDRPATRILHDRMKIVPADAAAGEVWNFLGLVVLPDLVVWRFPDRAEDRMLGRGRNALRRLWWRAEVIGADLIDRSDGLGEDELVNIMERPTLAADRRLARKMAVAVLGASSVAVSRSELMRDFAKRMLRAQGAFCLDVLSENAMDAIVQVELGNAVGAMTGIKAVGSEEPRPRPTIDVAHLDPSGLDVTMGQADGGSSVVTWTRPYEFGEAKGRASPANCRFRPDSPLAAPYVTRYLESLIETEAPVHVEVLFNAFRRDWEVDPYANDMTAALDRALQRCSVGGRRVDLAGDNFVRVIGKPIEFVRVPSGDEGRPPQLVPPEEMHLALSHLRRDYVDSSALTIAMCELFGWSQINVPTEVRDLIELAARGASVDATHPVRGAQHPN